MRLRLMRAYGEYFTDRNEDTESHFSIVKPDIILKKLSRRERRIQHVHGRRIKIISCHIWIDWAALFFA